MLSRLIPQATKSSGRRWIQISSPVVGMQVPSNREKFGGMEFEVFRHLVEKVGPFIDVNFKPKLTSLSKTELTLSVPFNKNLVGNPAVPCLHGGAVASIIDHSAGFACWAALEDPHLRVSTVDLRVDYLLPAPLETLHYVATLQHKSSKLGRVDVVCYDASYSKKIAIGRACFNIYRVQEDLQVILKKHLKASEDAAAASTNQDSVNTTH